MIPSELRVLIVASDSAVGAALEHGIRRDFPGASLVDSSTLEPGAPTTTDGARPNLIAVDAVDGLGVALARVAPVLAAFPDAATLVVARGSEPGCAADALPATVDEVVLMPDAEAPRLSFAIPLAFERARQRRALAEIEARFRSLFEHVPVGLYRTTPEGKMLDANPGLVSLLGYPSREALLAVNTRELYVNPADRDAWRAIMERDGVVTDFETQKRRLDGSVVWLRDSARVVRDAQGGILHYEGAVVDVTRKRAIEDALRVSRASTQALLDAIPDALFRVDRAGECLDSRLPKHHGLPLPPGPVVGNNLADLLGLGPPELTAHIDRALRSGEVDAFECELGPPDRLRWFAIRVSPTGTEQALVLVHDASSLKRMQERVHLADRMASVGALASGVVHEISNPLSYVITNLEYLREQLHELPRLGVQSGVPDEVLEKIGEARNAIDDVLSGATRVHRIVKNLRSFASRNDDVRTAVKLRRPVEAAIDMAWNEIRHRARLERSFARAPDVRANDARLVQLFLGLLLNAAQAIPEGDAEANEIRVSVSTATDGRAVVEISDTGCGIPPQILPKVFDPFFTTKPKGDADGLGLAICQGIVAAHGGEITLESAPGRTTARVILPPDELTSQPPSSGFEALAVHRRASVLVVDDEPLVGVSIRRILSAKHDVWVETSAAAALELIESGTQFDCILTDLMMPVTTGMEFHERLVSLAPDQARRVAVLTGGAFSPRAQQFLQTAGLPVLKKPFSAQDVRALVAQIVGLGRSGSPTA